MLLFARILRIPNVAAAAQIVNINFYETRKLFMNAHKFIFIFNCRIAKMINLMLTCLNILSCKLILISCIFINFGKVEYTSIIVHVSCLTSAYNVDEYFTIHEHNHNQVFDHHTALAC